jgi:hypothetical protein
MTATFRAISRFNTSPRKNFPRSDDGVDAVGSVRLRYSRWNLKIVFQWAGKEMLFVACHDRQITLFCVLTSLKLQVCEQKRILSGRFWVFAFPKRYGRALTDPFCANLFTLFPSGQSGSMIPRRSRFGRRRAPWKISNALFSSPRA